MDEAVKPSDRRELGNIGDAELTAKVAGQPVARPVAREILFAQARGELRSSRRD